MMKLQTRIGSWALLPWVAFAETEKPNIVFIMAENVRCFS
jgi:hypothetical protein